MTFLPPAFAAQPSVDACRGRILQEFTTVRDEYRAHLYGSRKNTKDGITVVSGGHTSSEMKGILETKGRMTSELIEPIVKSYRALHCKMLAVCQAVSDSISYTGASLQEEILGCKTVTLPRFEECSLANSVVEEASSFEDVVTIQAECQKLVKDTLAAEKAVLRVAVGYDAGYRSLLQFAGMMDWMQEQLSERAIRPLRDMVNLLGKLHQIPCFIGQCDNPTPPKQ